VVTVNVCSPVLSFNVPDTVKFCTATATLANFTASNSTQLVPGVGANNYTWSIAPTTGASFQNQFVYHGIGKITNTVITVYTVTLRGRNASGTAPSLTHLIHVDFCLSDTVGVGENGLESGLLVYPNPAHDRLVVKLPAGTGKYNIEMFNVLGAVVFSDKAIATSEQTVELNLSGKPKGIYFLSVEVNHEKVTRKIIIE
jgi:hypothetical protein